MTDADEARPRDVPDNSAVTATTPFGPGSVSLGLHPDTSLPASAQVSLLLDQARAAEAAGFDGVTLSEHHANFAGYLPQPLLACGWMLEATERVWAAPTPLLLGLRHAVLVAEEVSWTAARHPGRVSLAVASGYASSDLDLVGLDQARRTERFREQQALLMDALGGRHSASADAAITAWAAAPAPVLSATNSVSGVRLAAALGMGIVYPGGEDPDRLGALTVAYRDAGGTGPVVWIRGFWIGSPPETAAAAALAATYRERSPTGTRQSEGFHSPVLSGSPAEILELARDHVERAGVDAVNARLHVAGVSADVVGAQIERFGADVVPGLRGLLGAVVR
jgi:alkanesulfonate monooxygenase SsuD/methylene tetrahydromethanopterin reductase-like flavin-dependent oxidoreductase (luciferase family)